MTSFMDFMRWPIPLVQSQVLALTSPSFHTCTNTFTHTHNLYYANISEKTCRSFTEHWCKSVQAFMWYNPLPISFSGKLLRGDALHLHVAYLQKLLMQFAALKLEVEWGMGISLSNSFAIHSFVLAIEGL